MDCNEYSHGCKGGFGEHVGKFAEDFGILTDEEYGGYNKSSLENGTDGYCHGGKFLKGERYFFQATQSLGGYAGAVTDALEMQWELYRNGPFSVAVNVNGSFRKFNPYDPEHTDISLNESENTSRHYFYEEVNHLVLLVGWVTRYNETTSENETFWIIQNSWGMWGPTKDGSMEIIMGRNAYAIESQPVTTYWRQKGAGGYS